MAAWPDGRRHRKTYAKGRLDGGFGRRKARQKRFAGSNDDRRLVFGGECVDGILPGEKGDLYDLYPTDEPKLRVNALMRATDGVQWPKTGAISQAYIIVGYDPSVGTKAVIQLF